MFDVDILCRQSCKRTSPAELYETVFFLYHFCPETLLSLFILTPARSNINMMSFSGGWAAFVSCLLAVSAVATGNDAVVTDTSPACAHACQRSIYPLILACSNQDSNENIYDRGSFEVTSPECRGSDTSYLTTLAWCMST